MAMLEPSHSEEPFAQTGKDTFVYDDKGKKDPFLPAQPVWTAERTATRLGESFLEGIVWDETRPLAILDGEILKEGDPYLGAQVRAIRRDRAVFAVGQEEITVMVAPDKQETDPDAR